MKKNLLLLITSVILTVLALDVVLRHPYFALRFHSQPGVYYLNRFPKMHKTLRHNSSIKLNAKVAGDLSAMLGKYKDYKKDRSILFITDKLGFRNTRDYKTEWFDTIILGDSFGFAGTTDQSDLLSEQLNSKKYQAYNISTTSIGLWDEVVTSKYVIKYDKLKMTGNKNIIWLLYEGNDLEGNFYNDVFDPDKLINSKIKELSVRVENYYKRSLIKLMIKRMLRRLFSSDKNQKSPVLRKHFFDKEMLFYAPYVDTLRMTINQIYQNENYEHIKRIVNSMANFASAGGFSLTCVVIPLKSRVYEWVLHDKKPWTSDRSQSAFSIYFQDLCKSNHINFIDLTPGFINSSKMVYEKNGEALYWLNDSHWNDIGQRIAASIIDKSIKRWLESNYQKPVLVTKLPQK